MRVACGVGETVAPGLGDTTALTAVGVSVAAADAPGVCEIVGGAVTVGAMVATAASVTVAVALIATGGVTDGVAEAEAVVRRGVGTDRTIATRSAAPVRPSPFTSHDSAASKSARVASARRARGSTSGQAPRAGTASNAPSATAPPMPRAVCLALPRCVAPRAALHRPKRCTGARPLARAGDQLVRLSRRSILVRTTLRSTMGFAR